MRTQLSEYKRTGFLSKLLFKESRHEAKLYVRIYPPTTFLYGRGRRHIKAGFKKVVGGLIRTITYVAFRAP